MTEPFASAPRTVCDLGYVAWESASVEHGLRLLLARVLGGTRAAELVAAGQSAGWLIDTLSAIAKDQLSPSDDASGNGGDAEAWRTLLEVLSRCTDAMKRRHHVVHGYITARPGDGALLSHRSKLRAGYVDSYVIDAGFFNTLYEDLQKINTDLLLLSGRLG